MPKMTKNLLKSDENQKNFGLYLFLNLRSNKMFPFSYKKPTVIKLHGYLPTQSVRMGIFFVKKQGEVLL